MNCVIGRVNFVWAFHCFFIELSSRKWVVSPLFKDVLWTIYVVVVILYMTRITMLFWPWKLKNYIGDMSLDFIAGLFVEYPACTKYLRIYISFFYKTNRDCDHSIFLFDTGNEKVCLFCQQNYLRLYLRTFLKMI